MNGLICCLVFMQVDTSEQLRNVSKMKLYRYRYSREYLEHAGLATEDSEGEGHRSVGTRSKRGLTGSCQGVGELIVKAVKCLKPCFTSFNFISFNHFHFEHNLTTRLMRTHSLFWFFHCRMTWFFQMEKQ